MLKTIKIPEEAYKDAKKLTNKLEKDKVIVGLYKVKLSTAVGYAIKKALEELMKREKFLSSAGGWSDIDKELVKEIYEKREKGTKWSLSLD